MVPTGYDHLLIDMKNLLYRSFFTGFYDKAFKASGRDYMCIVMNFISGYVSKFRPKAVHVFWDAPRQEVWRRAIMPDYKEHRAEMYKDLEVNVQDEIGRLIELSTEFLKAFGIHQYFREGQEADDLVYAFCAANRSARTVMISSDGDYRQIIFNYKNVDLYNPLDKTKQLVPVPEHDPSIYKALVGDKSDNIKGYFRLQKKKALIYVTDLKARGEFFASPKAAIKDESGKLVVVGAEHFKRNLGLVDLSLCPHLLDNLMYVTGKLIKPVKFSRQRIEETISKHKLRGLTAELGRYTAPFITGVNDGYVACG
jgi:5'-3' exonuclease